jgi:ubiquitin-like domain-containing CTD phosphatase 1
VKVPQLDTIGDLKSLLWTLTSVPPERMKLLGLVKGKLPGDEQEMGSLGLGGAGGDKGFMMVS